jgi:hypothetical protein
LAKARGKWLAEGEERAMAYVSKEMK